jgi:uncharacterized membrane protein SpoIIM required for sporulation
LAHALIDPGVRPRGQALREDARGAARMALGTAPWLVPAGLTEGFVTPNALPDAPALAIGCVLAGLYWGCVLFCGRQRRARAFARR